MSCKGLSDIIKNEHKAFFMAELSSGTVLRGQTYSYRIERMLGSGTFGITYLAVVSDGAGPMNGMLRVCVKEFYMHDINGRNGSEVTCSSSDGMFSEYRRKFMREAENLASINHPHIIHVLEAFEQNNTVYYVMEFVAGGSLDSFICKHGRMDEASALKCLAGIAEGLQYMHSQKMLHLDLKPANVMLKNDGSPVLIDFGLSKQYNEKGEPESSTKVGSGTPGYAPVEQANYHDGHEFPVTMDVYALGGTLFKMLTGERPPEASMVLNDGLPVDLLHRYGVSKATIAAIIGAMAPIVKQRTPDVASFVKALPLGSAYKYSGASKASSSTKTSSSSSYSSSSSSSSFKRKKDVSQNLSEGIVYLTPDTTRVKIILNGVGKAQGKSWFFVFTPSKISVVEHDTYDYRSFFSSKQRFGSVLERINALRLSVSRDISLDERFLCTLIAERENEVYVDAVSGADFIDDSYYLKGDVAALVEIVENETGVDVTGRKWKRQRIKNFVIMGVVAVVALAAWWMFKGNNSSTYNNVESEQNVEQTNSSETAEQQQQALPEISNEQAVDLGLSSGTIWAGWNVGATSAEQCGDYYAWGETKTKKEYSNFNYFDLKNGADFEDFTTYYNEGGKTSIRCSNRDVAWVKWGHQWAIPTKDQADELVRECTWTWMKYNGANGFAVTGPNGKSLFLPAAGEHYTGLDSSQKDVNEVISVGEQAWYWTSELNKDYSASAYIISFVQKKAEVDVDGRSSGFSVRPVRVK